MKVKFKIYNDLLYVVNEDETIFTSFEPPFLHLIELDEFPDYLRLLAANARLAILDFKGNA